MTSGTTNCVLYFCWFKCHNLDATSRKTLYFMRRRGYLFSSFSWHFSKAALVVLVELEPSTQFIWYHIIRTQGTKITVTQRPSFAGLYMSHELKLSWVTTSKHNPAWWIQASTYFSIPGSSWNFVCLPASNKLRQQNMDSHEKAGSTSYKMDIQMCVEDAFSDPKTEHCTYPLEDELFPASLGVLHHSWVPIPAVGKGSTGVSYTRAETGID